MPKRLSFVLRVRTREGVYKLRARITPGNQTAMQVLDQVNYLEQRARLNRQPKLAAQ